MHAVGKTIFASAFCDDYDKNNVRWSYPRFYLTDCWHYLEGILCDSAFYPGELKRQFGISMEKVHTLYFPTEIAAEPRYRSQSSQRILWAGRLTLQKRPDLLIGAARALPDVFFDVYGYAYNHHDKKYEKELSKLPNVRLCGSYDSFGALISANDYALYFYTSEWDGLPNVLLEAVAHGLPVVASAVCGIPELINEETGYPVSETANLSAYVARIKEALANDSERRRRWENAFDLLQSRHSATIFLQRLYTIDRYL
jgi:glycosyltransferase involved in cell wall biosynthesis